MPVRAVALKEEGTHPPSEGVLARFAEVRSVRSLKDLEKVKEERPDIVLMDVRMPQVDGKEVVEVLRQTRPAPVLVLFDSKMQPATLLKHLNSLGTPKTTRHGRSRSLSQVVRLLGVSQEVLSRILNVSARTAHRWLKGTRPRPAVVFLVGREGLDPLATTRSLKAGGRFNPPNEFGALYTSLEATSATKEVARGLRQRGVDPDQFPEGAWWVYELEVKLEAVLDFTDADVLQKSGIA